MLRGEKVVLRAREDSDVALLHDALATDVEERSRTGPTAWRPTPGGEHSPFAVSAPADDVARFTIVEHGSGAVVGAASLWSIDLHNRLAHIGLSLLPAARGRGLGLDTVRVLVRYGFRTLGLHRLQIDTLADNAAMIGVATAAGFAQEGVLRRSAWVNGEFVDELILALLNEARA